MVTARPSRSSDTSVAGASRRRLAGIEPQEQASSPTAATNSSSVGMPHLVLHDVAESTGVAAIARALDDLGPQALHTDGAVLAVSAGRTLDPQAEDVLAGRHVRSIPVGPEPGPGSRRGVTLAVAAGLWLSRSKPGDILEIVSDDLVFDTVGNVATGRGAVFRRVPYRQPEDGMGLAASNSTNAPARSKSRRKKRRG